MLIKVCGLSDLAEIKELANSEVDLIGFIFHSASKRNLVYDEAKASEIRNLTIKKVGVFVNESYD